MVAFNSRTLVARYFCAHIATDSIGLVASDIGNLAAVDRVFFFTSNGGFQSAIIVFRSLASNRFRQSSFNGIALVAMNSGALVACYFRAHIATDGSAQVRLVIFHHIARNGSFHFATNGRRQIPANGIGHIF